MSEHIADSYSCCSKRKVVVLLDENGVARAVPLQKVTSVAEDQLDKHVLKRADGQPIVLEVIDDCDASVDDSTNFETSSFFDNRLPLPDDRLPPPDDRLPPPDHSLSIPDNGLSPQDDGLLSLDNRLSLSDDRLPLSDEKLSPTDDILADSEELADSITGKDAWSSRSIRRTSKRHKTGMWSLEEVKTLEANIKEYCERNLIDEPVNLILNYPRVRRRHFYRFISRGINRPLFSIYRRTVRMYDSKNHIGRYSPEEVEQLRKLCSVHGNKWNVIGKLMGRSASSVKDRVRVLTDHCNHGKWAQDEEERLRKAVQEQSMSEQYSNHRTINWTIVTNQVRTRSEKQCRTKWLNHLGWKSSGGEEWSLSDDWALIETLYNLSVTDEEDINWTVLYDSWPNGSARSPQWLRARWWCLKQQVYSTQPMTYRDALSILYDQCVHAWSHKDGDTQSHTPTHSAADRSDRSDVCYAEQEQPLQPPEHTQLSSAELNCGSAIITSLGPPAVSCISREQETVTDGVRTCHSEQQQQPSKPAAVHTEMAPSALTTAEHAETVRPVLVAMPESCATPYTPARSTFPYYLNSLVAGDTFHTLAPSSDIAGAPIFTQTGASSLPANSSHIIVYRHPLHSAHLQQPHADTTAIAAAAAGTSPFLLGTSLLPAQPGTLTAATHPQPHPACVHLLPADHSALAPCQLESGDTAGGHAAPTLVCDMGAAVRASSALPCDLVAAPLISDSSAAYSEYILAAPLDLCQPVSRETQP